VFDAANRHDLRELKPALESLLSFLSAEGRTDANCCATDAFFSAVEGQWLELPDEYRKLLSDLGGVLHDAVHAPHIASTFECLPEQLLDRVRRIEY